MPTTNIALVGGAAAYHARSFSCMFNGLQGELPAGWPNYAERVGDSPDAADCRITTVWDPDPAAARELAEVFGIERVAATMEEAAEGVDGVIVTDDLSLTHQKRAPFFLERGLPTYIDKPFATDIVEAEAIAAIAERTGAPLMSCSSLRFAAETAALRHDPTQLGTIELATAVGRGELLFYGIHAFEAAYAVLGPGIKSVTNIGEDGRHVAKLTYRDGRVLMLMVSETIANLFQLNFYGDKGWQQVVVRDAGAFYVNNLRKIVEMVRTGKSHVPVSETLEIIRVLLAAKQSLREGRTIEMDEAS